jgi:hypothetical protein
VRSVGRADERAGRTWLAASIANPLAEAKLSLFAVSTYDTDYVLVRKQSLTAVIGCLNAAGHEVVLGALE